jgi:nitrogen fixation NifU-like protein
MMVTDSGFEAMHNILMGDMKQIYTESVIDHATNPRHVGSLVDADGFAISHSDCGENMEIWLQVKNNRIEDIRFWSDGCAATIACGSMVSELARGKNVVDALKINEEDAIKAFGGLPEGNFHCATLAVNTLKEAIADYLALKKDPWKKVYRRK